MTNNRWTPGRVARAVHRRARGLAQSAWLPTSKRALPLLAPAVAMMARTGAGTDECLAHGALPMPVHFYSPVPDIADLRARNVWTRRSQMKGVNFGGERQLTFMRSLGDEYGHECNWPHRSDNPQEFQTDNSGFSYGCAAMLHSVLRHFKPRRVVEIGSGNSTRVIAGAVRRNSADGVATKFTVVDPYPSDETRKIQEIQRFEKERVELLDPSLFDELEENDVLFVDSGHTVRIGGDVNFLILDVLPRLKKGVVAHFHDIPMPFEYNEVYFTNPAFRMFWTESYLLQAFLCLNDSFETLLAMSWIMEDHKREFAAAFPNYAPEIHLFNSSSYWIRRTR